MRRVVGMGVSIRLIDSPSSLNMEVIIERGSSRIAAGVKWPMNIATDVGCGPVLGDPTVTHAMCVSAKWQHLRVTASHLSN